MRCEDLRRILQGAYRHFWGFLSSGYLDAGLRCVVSGKCCRAELAIVSVTAGTESSLTLPYLLSEMTCGAPRLTDSLLGATYFSQYIRKYLSNSLTSLCGVVGYHAGMQN